MNLQKSMYSDSSDSFRDKTLQQYKNDYFDVLDYYQKLNEDNDEINFVNTEIRLIREYIRPAIENEITELEKTHGLDLKMHMIRRNQASYIKIIEFLESRKSELEANLQMFQKMENILIWRETQTAFMEIVKALIVSGAIHTDNKDNTEKVIVDTLSKVFGMKINNPYKLINDLKNKNNDSETQFLDKLKKSLFEFISKEKKK